MLDEVSSGVSILGLVTFLLLIGASILYSLLSYSELYLYTCGMLALLCIHIIFTARKLPNAKSLYLLSMTLIIVSGTAFVLLAHREGSFTNALLPTIVMLFMVIPIVPWGLREGVTIVSLVYLVFTLSTLSVEGRFSSDNLFVLQFMMMVSALVSLTILSRNVMVRKDDIKARYELELAHKKMERLSYEDGLTGAWNRRYLEVQFKRVLRRMRENSSRNIYFALFDIDDFKKINDLHGHLTGDDVLKDIAHVFQDELGEHSHVFRIGGDEFVIIFEDDDYVAPLEKATNRIRQKASGIEGVNVSIGLVEVKGVLAEIVLDTLYSDADKLLYSAKTRKQQKLNELNCEASHILGQEK